MVKKIDTLILGATFYGCGLARHIPDAVVVESSIAPGSDRVFAFAPGSNWDLPCRHPEAEEFRQELICRHAVSPEGKVINGALAPVLANWCIRHGIQPYLGLELIETQGNTLTFADFCGKKITFHARNIINAGEDFSGSKQLTAAIKTPVQLSAGTYGNFTVTPSGAESVSFAALDVPPDIDYPAARQRFYRTWANRPAALQEAKLILTAARFSGKRFANAAAALDAGLTGEAPALPVPDVQYAGEAKYDLVVCGAGTAGIITAITAARRGLNVLALEKTATCGGVWTSGFIPGFYIQKPTGIARELRERALERQGFFGHTENVRYELEQTALACGVKLEYCAAVADCIKSGSRVTGIRYRNAAGQLVSAYAPVISDATAEAVVCRGAGCKLTNGRQSDHEFNSYTNTMGMVRADGFRAANFDAGRIAQHDAADFSAGYLESLTVHLKDDYRADCSCLQLADIPGIREGQRIVPEKPYTLKNYFENSGTVPETIFSVISNLDTHAQDIFFESETFQDWQIAASCWQTRISIPIPRQILFPAGISGVIAAARHLGADHDLGCALRMIPGLTAIAEVAGHIAFEAVKRGIPPEKVPFAAIKDFIPPSPDAPASLNAAWHSMGDDEIAASLDSPDPGLAIWNIKQQKKQFLAEKLHRQAEKGSRLYINTAIALALAGETAVIPQLMEIVRNDDTTPVNANMRYSATRKIAAIYLLGRLGAAAAAELLCEKLNGKECVKTFGHTVMALLKIGNADPGSRAAIGHTLCTMAEDASWRTLEQLKGSGAALRRSDGLIRWHIARTLEKWGISHTIDATIAALKLDKHEKWVWANY